MCVTSFVTRILTSDDAGKLAALESLVFPDAWDADRYERLLTQGILVAAGILQGDVLCGYVSAYRMDAELEILNLAILAELRGQGLGKRLLGFLLDVARAENVGRILLDVRAGNISALGLYADFGFQQTGRRKGYYENPREDALLLEWRPDF